MNRFMKTAILSCTIAATMLSALPSAQAGDRYGERHWRDHHRKYERSSSSRNSDLAVAGILGLAAGALIVGLNARSEAEPFRDNQYRKPRPRPVREYPQAAFNRGGAEPWSRSWYSYCSDRYRSFNPNTGTYMGYDGQERFCVAN